MDDLHCNRLSCRKALTEKVRCPFSTWTCDATRSLLLNLVILFRQSWRHAHIYIVSNALQKYSLRPAHPWRVLHVRLFLTSRTMWWYVPIYVYAVLWSNASSTGYRYAPYIPRMIIRLWGCRHTYYMLCSLWSFPQSQSILSGLSPAIILEICSRCVSHFMKASIPIIPTPLDP